MTFWYVCLAEYPGLFEKDIVETEFFKPKTKFPEHLNILSNLVIKHFVILAT
jgi:hypothetical protein